MTFAAYSLARQMADNGHDWKDIVRIVRFFEFRIEVEEAIALYRDRLGRAKG